MWFCLKLKFKIKIFFNFQYSAKSNKVYIKMNQTFTVNISYLPKNVDLFLRAMIVYSLNAEIHNPVVRCNNHRTEKNESKFCDFLSFQIQFNFFVFFLRTTKCCISHSKMWTCRYSILWVWPGSEIHWQIVNSFAIRKKCLWRCRQWEYCLTVCLSKFLCKWNKSKIYCHDFHTWRIEVSKVRFFIFFFSDLLFRSW